MVTIIEIIRSKASRCLYTTVYCYLSCCQVLIPVILLVADIVSQYLLQCPVARSVCPSVCGWYAVLIFSCVPHSFHSSCQNLDVKRRSLSLIMCFGMPCSLTTMSKNIRATWSAVHVVVVAA